MSIEFKTSLCIVTFGVSVINLYQRDIINIVFMKDIKLLIDDNNKARNKTV